MYRDGTGELVVSATDVVGFLECPHLTELDRAVALGLAVPPTRRADPTLDILTDRGTAHERAVLDGLRAAGRSVVEIAPPDEVGGLAAAQERTLAAMRAGPDVIYQATFFDGRWRGHADFLEKVPGRPSRLGDWAYDVADTKLARRPKVSALLQMALYGDLLATLQGVPPRELTVITGDRRRESFRFSDCASYARLVRRRFLDRLADGPQATYPTPVAHCSICRWAEPCAERRRADDHLSLVAAMRSDHARALAAAGFGTVRALAGAAPADLPAGIGEASRERLVAQARLQVGERESGRPAYELLPHLPGRGFALLPEPSAGDLFFDIEGDPFAGPDGLEYLWGVCDTRGEFTAYWAHDAEAERRAVEAVIDRFTAAAAADPAMHVYHYAPYEPSRLKALTARYDTRLAELDRLLRAERLVDLYTVVRQGLRISRGSYSIKELEAFYAPGGRAGATIAGGGESVVAYERWLATRDPTVLAEIAAYNRTDCRSTQVLRDWLEQRRAELADRGVELARPAERSGDPSQDQQDAEDRTQQLTTRLLDDLPEDTAAMDAREQATWLLAQSLGWHRREARSQWWEHFRLRGLVAEDLEFESAAVGPLGPPTLVDTVKKSGIWRYEFPPQECKVRPEDQLEHLDGVPGTSTVTGIDAERGWITLRRGLQRAEPHPRGLLPTAPVPDTVLRQALTRLAAEVLRTGIAGPGRFRAARDLLLRNRPRLPPGEPLRRPRESPADALARLAGRLDRSTLAVQGPPGTGKTWAGARAVVELVRAGRRVGITAFSHQAIGNLLAEVMRAARTAGVPVRAVQKATDQQGCGDPDVTCVDDKGAAIEAILAGDCDVLAGTAWLFAEEQLAEALDVLVVDEAGQLSLANALAVSQAGRALILLGDPQQLRQPGKGVHPPGSDGSALEHVLGGAATMPADLGLFFERTHRLGPALCGVVSELFYEDRLHPDGAALQRRWAAADGLVGVRWHPVEHDGNVAASSEEAVVVSELLTGLLRRSLVDAAGRQRRVGIDDVLVVTPYNAQVARLRGALPAGARIGTVDRFQGQEAAVVIVSLASSSAADAPRGVDFLLDRHRLNVAISRAQLLAIVVGSPRLLSAPVRHPRQLLLVNALCRIAEGNIAEGGLAGR